MSFVESAHVDHAPAKHMTPGMGEGVLGFKIFCWRVGVEAVPDRHALRRHFDLVNFADRTLTLRQVFRCEEAKRDIGT